MESDSEILWTELDSHLGKIIFGIFYNPSSKTVMYLDELETSLQKCASFNKIILCGDFNVDLDGDNTCPRNKTLVKHLSTITDSFGLSQLVNEATRVTETTSSLIDHAYVSQPLLNSNIRLQVISPLGKSDHSSFIARMDLKILQCHEVPRSVWLYNKANWDEARSALSRLPTEPDEFLDLDGSLEKISTLNGMIDSIWSSFYNQFMAIMNSNIPQRRLSKKRNLPWITGDLKKLIGRRNRLFKRAKSSNSTDHWNAYKKLRNSIVSKIRQAKREYFDSVSDSGNVKDLWGAYKLLSGRESLPTSINDGVSSVNAPDDKANLFNNFFTRCFEPSELNLDLYNFSNDLVVSDESRLSFLIAPQLTFWMLLVS